MYNKEKLSVTEVSAILGIDSRRVRKLIENGSLSAINLSSGTIRPVWAVEAEDIDKFLASRKNKQNG